MTAGTNVRALGAPIRAAGLPAVVAALLAAPLPVQAQSGGSTAAQAAVAPSASGTTAVTLPAVADHRAQLNAFKLRIDALRSKVSGIEARVAGLKQTVLVGAVLATRARLLHRNEMSGNFKLEKAVYRLDGDVIFSRTAEDGLADAKEIVLFDGPLTPGGHAVDVEMVFKGAAVGVFTYLQGYKYNVRSRYQLDVVEGRNTVLKVVAYEDEDITVEAQQRFKVRYDVEVNDDSPRPVGQ